MGKKSMIEAELQIEIERRFGKKITMISPLSSADAVKIYCVALESGVSYVVKIAARGLDVEAWMLNYLKEKSKLPVPAVYHSTDRMIIMEFIESKYGIDEAGQRNAAELLAGLHGIGAEDYGLERNTLFAGFFQPNPQTEDWVRFFAEQRLLYAAGEALKEKKIDNKIMKQVEKLAGKLSKYIKQPNPPGLIHGDVWGGNILSQNGKAAAFLDPAIYYADPEIELAFIRMLNTFGPAFFTRYNELRPIRPGFLEERADIYSLYPMLVYTRLFGSSYARKTQRILDKFT